MWKFFRGIPIFSRFLIVLIAAAVVPVIILVLLGNFYLQSFETRSQAVQTSFDAQNTATQEQINLQRMNALLQAHFAQVFAQDSLKVGKDPSLAASGGLVTSDVTTLDLDFRANLAAYVQNYQIATSSNMGTVRSILKSDAPHSTVISTQQTALNEVATSDPAMPGQAADWPRYESEQNAVLADLTNNSSYAQAYQDFFQANTDFLTLKNNWQQVVDTATEMGTTVTRVGPSLVNPLYIYTSEAIAFILLILIIAAVLVSSTIILPLNRLVSLTRHIALGDTKARAEVNGRDEINQVARSMNGMLDVTVRLMQDAQYRHLNLQGEIEKLIQTVSGIGQGDLRVRAEITPDELGMLANIFNTTAGQLNNLVVNVKSLARGVQNATLQTFGYIEQLADNADTQIQQIAEATLEVSNMATASQQVTERTYVLTDVARDARQIAQKGRSAVQQTVRGMAQVNNNVHATTERVVMLDKHSREIRDIVEIITSIAQQTNRLALDAAIQAAVASDRDTGFGAVAIDIRRLAERSKEQAVRIGQIVSSVTDDMNMAAQSIQETENEAAKGTLFTEEVGTALESIFAVVERQASEIEATNSVALKQLQSSKKVEQIMQQVAATTQQGNSNTNQAMQQMRTLAQIAGQLLTSVDVFKLKENRLPAGAENDVPRIQSQRESNRYRPRYANQNGSGNFSPLSLQETANNVSAPLDSQRRNRS